MIRRVLRLAPWVALAAIVVSLPSTLAAQSPWPEYSVEATSDPHALLRGPGFYLSIVKLVAVILAVLAWVKLADWVHRDVSTYGERIKLAPEIWNPLVVFPFFVAFLFTITFPLFLLSYPLLLAAVIAPPMIYAFVRNAKVPETERVLTTGHMKRVVSGQRSMPSMPTPQEIGPSVDFQPAIKDSRAAQACLISVRQNLAYGSLKVIFADAIARRVDQIALEYTAEAVAVRYLVDGLWHEMPVMDRQTGDAALYALKQLASLDPADRRSKQTGQFGISVPGRKLKVELTSQGVKTGERAVRKVIQERKKGMTLHELGMVDEMERRLRPHLNRPGVVIVSCLPGDGLTTSWNAVLDASDRVIRDFVALVPKGHTDTNVDNVEKIPFDPASNEDASKVLRTTLLKQPEAIVLPEPGVGGLLAPLLDEALDEQRFVITRIPARSAAEASLRLATTVDREKFAKAVTAIVYHRLVRRLCDGCKQPYAPTPQLLQKLGATRRIETLYKQWEPPPPEERVDKKGRPIEIPPCPTCGGLGYLGRIAIFELLEVDDEIRKAMVKANSVEAVQIAAKRQGHRSLQTEGLELVFDGVTSLPELQRVLKSGT